MATSDQFKNELRSQLETAAKRGAKHILINAGDLHRVVGDYPGPHHQMPTCCQVMQEEMMEGDLVFEFPEKGRGAGLTIRFRLPRDLWS